MFKFSPNTIKSLKYYVYGLKYPNSENDYFYIGKGLGNRVFSHVQQKIKKGIKDPKFEIINSLRKVDGPEIDNQITNKVKGIDSNKFGIMSIKNVEANYKGKDFTLNISAVCFKINQAWHKDLKEEALYNRIRGNWVLSINRAKRAEYGIGVHNGIIRGIYKICNWEPGRPSPRGYRYYFNGYKEDKLQKYIGYSLVNHPGHKVRGPLFYYNCK